MSEQFILRVKNLHVVLDGEEIIKGLSFQLKEREVLTIVGPNGAGKTVLLKALLGLLPYKGEILWKKGLKIGYLPQGLTHLKVKDLPLSVEEFFRLKKAERGKTLRFLNLVGIKKKEFLRKQIGYLSGGEFQRMLIAWALIDEPQVLLFDEPTTGIDVGGEKTIYSLLYQFWGKQNLGILLVTHDLDIVYKYSSNVLCLSNFGKCFGPPEKILTPQALERAYGGDIKFYRHKH